MYEVQCTTGGTVYNRRYSSRLTDGFIFHGTERGNFACLTSVHFSAVLFTTRALTRFVMYQLIVMDTVIRGRRESVRWLRERLALSAREPTLICQPSRRSGAAAWLAIEPFRRRRRGGMKKVVCKSTIFPSLPDVNGTTGAAPICFCEFSSTPPPNPPTV